MPEAFDFIAPDKDATVSLAESLDGPTVSAYRDLAKEEGIFLSLGGFHQRVSGLDGKVKNTHVLVDSEGRVVSTYSKAHLFDVNTEKVKIKESGYVEAGDRVGVPVDSPAGKIGLGICFDLRFPEFSSLLSRSGAVVLTFPSAFTSETGKAHWEALLRARAIENQCYVAAAAQVGGHGGKRASHGHACLIDPWGVVVAQCDGLNEGFVTAEVNLDYVAKVREGMPLWQCRRTDLYSLADASGCAEAEDFRFGPNITIKKDLVVLASKGAYITVNLKPVVPGHLLVIPRRDAPRLRDLSAEDTAELFLLARRAQALVERHFGADSSTLAVQDGAAAGQTVSQVHVHVLPRKEGDFARNDEVYDRLHRHEEERRARGETEMREEADSLRKTLSDMDNSHVF